MLEWVTSKVVVSVAALVILASVSGFFVTQREGWKENEVVNISKEIAKLVNQVSTVNSNVTAVIFFGEKKGAINLPSSIDGSSYDVQFDRTSVRCDSKGRSGSSEFYVSVHLFPPSEIDLSNLTIVRGHDLDHQTLKLSSAGHLVLMRAKTASGGTSSFETFVFTGA